MPRLATGIDVALDRGAFELDGWAKTAKKYVLRFFDGTVKSPTQSTAGIKHNDV